MRRIGLSVQKKNIFYGDVTAARKTQVAHSGLQTKYLGKSIKLEGELTPSWVDQRRKVMNTDVAVRFHDP